MERRLIYQDEMDIREKYHLHSTEWECVETWKTVYMNTHRCANRCSAMEAIIVMDAT